MDKELFRYKGMKKTISLLTALSILQGAAVLLQAITLAKACTSLFRGKMDSTFYQAVILFAAAFLARQMLVLIKQKIAQQYAAITAAELRKRVLHHLFQLGPRYTRKEGTGDLVTLSIEGTVQFRRYLELFLPKMTALAVLTPMVGIYTGLTDHISGVILLISFPILIIFMILLGWAAKAKADKQWKTYRVLSNHFTDSLKGLETLKFLGLSRRHEKNIAGVSEKYRKATMDTLKVAFLSSFALDFFSMLSIATAAVFLGLRLIEGHMALGPALTVLLLAPEYFLPVREAGSDYHATLNGKEAGKRMQELLAEPLFAERTESAAPDWDINSTLSLDGIQVREGNSEILTNAEFECSGFQKIGLIGASGAGKSTLIDLIGGFLEPASGSIKLNGRSYPHLHMEDWQRQLAIIPQHPYLFSGTLAANISFYEPQASLAQIQAAAEKAGLISLIKELPNGLQEKIGEGGRQLSGGQGQRVALARAFLADRPILLLDEPTSQLDIETEYELKQTMLKLFEGKLVFLATHRLHWMPFMDQVIVLDKGKTAEIGTHENLLLAKGCYFELAKSHWGENAI